MAPLLCAAALMLPPALACAQAPEQEVFALHGYGHVQAVHSRDGERPRDELEHDLSLLGIWSVSPRAKVWLQVVNHDGAAGVRMDWAFASLDLSETTTLYLGQPRLPLSLNNETRDVQALRPSASLPLLYDEELGLADETFRGVLLEHRLRSPELGEFTVEGFAASAVAPHAGSALRGRVAGGRTTWHPVGSDWTWKVSGYAGHVRVALDGQERKQALVLSGRLDRGQWALQAEAGHARPGDRRLNLAYLQLDHALYGNWRAFGRVEQGLSEPGEGPTVRERSLAAGLAWRADAHWGLRLEGSHHRGRLDDNDAADASARRVHNQIVVAVNYLF